MDLSKSTIRSDLALLSKLSFLEAKPKVGYLYVKDERKDLRLFLEKIKVDDVKSMPIIVEETCNVYDCIVNLFLEDVGSLYVTKNNYLSGIISRKDFLKIAIANNDLKKLPVGMIMTRMPNVIWVKSTDTVWEAISKIIKYEVDSLPVVVNEKGNYKIVGKFSKTNIARLIVEE